MYKCINMLNKEEETIEVLEICRESFQYLSNVTNEKYGVGESKEI